MDLRHHAVQLLQSVIAGSSFPFQILCQSVDLGFSSALLLLCLLQTIIQRSHIFHNQKLLIRASALLPVNTMNRGSANRARLSLFQGTTEDTGQHYRFPVHQSGQLSGELRNLSIQLGKIALCLLLLSQELPYLSFGSGLCFHGRPDGLLLLAEDHRDRRDPFILLILP